MTNTVIDIRPGTYPIDPAASTLRFTATHTFGLKPVHGTLPITSGTVVVAEEPRRSTVSAEIDATGWQTGDARRDRDIQGPRFLDTGRHPVIGFRSTRVTRTADSWTVVGELSVRGGSYEVPLTVTGIRPDGFTAVARVDRVAAGVPGGRALIGRHVDVTLAITLG